MGKHVIITVGRQFGSGGKQIAMAIGEKLGIKVYDNEILSEAARMSGFSKDVFETRDEKRRLWGIGYPSGLNDTDLFRMQSDVIRDIASREDAIFLGRAADYVLRDMDCLDVFVWAPMEVRKNNVCAREGIAPDEAESYIFKKDRKRAEFYNFFTFGHWGKASGYDLCIDSSILGIEGTADFIIEFGRRCGKIL